ncbi:hypothetical protein P691DRAFT_763426 [Macrolepiota fuliginosa MF-IS2]|uniref:Uncharacterized protein n=1 Tax=Macrolepiota fuliginosa MF-IS2 TaxID=1400762 RepID=A0A9P5X760_9AGAR|nr:hypothetical protein P691DRAFT_763426 [Macrolepiota fuliginosa MF-IS2]
MHPVPPNFTAIEAVDTNQRNDRLQARKSRQVKQDEIFKVNDPSEKEKQI